MTDSIVAGSAPPLDTNRQRLRILCVGDGDLTFSLALIRAYSAEQIELTASTLLPNTDDLVATYTNSASVLTELEERGVIVLFGVDATQLHTAFIICGQKQHFDWILFCHPHLGLQTLREDEAWHAERHYRLLAHYFWSAQQVLAKEDHARIYLCLCGRQPETWRMLEASGSSSLRLVEQLDTTVPLPLSPYMVELPSQSQYAAPRKYRNGKLGSKHYLGRFGYQHRPTYPTSAGSTVNVEHSQHYTFQRQQTCDNIAMSVAGTENELACHTCKAKCKSQEELQQHYKAPALPHDPQPTKTSNTNEEPSEKKVLTVGVSGNNTSVRAGPVEWGGTISLSNDAGQRLRQTLRNLELAGLKSKRQAEDRIKHGCVTLNGDIARDSSRMVQLNDVLEIRRLETTATAGAANSMHRIDVVHQNADWVVAMKPVGTRTKGSFSEETLESMVSKQLILNDGNSNIKYTSLSNLDKGCAGLSVLQTQQQSNDSTQAITVQHKITALVHGRIDWKEKTLEVSGGGGRRWRRSNAGGTNKKRSLDEVAGLPENGVPAAPLSQDTAIQDSIATAEEDACAQTSNAATEAVHVACTQQTSERAPALSTVVLTTSNTSQVRVDHLCAALRQLGHGVVNDRFGRDNVDQLPRSMRNLIKNRLCIGCFQVCINDDEVISVHPPDRLSANYWQQRHDAAEDSHSKDERDT